MGLWMFAMRLSCSGRAFHVIFAHQAQEALFEGHVLAFAHFGGVPARIRYDNLKDAVTRILVGRDRVETSGSSRCGHITGSTRSSASRASRARTRRAEWKAKSAALRRAHLVPVPEAGRPRRAQPDLRRRGRRR
jgi:hypothetical protein